MKRYLLILVLLAAGFAALGQSDSDCPRRGEIPFKEGERLAYELSYNWGLLWVDAGYIIFTVNDTLVDNEKLYNFKAYGSSYRSWDWFYKVRSTYQSWATTDLNSREFHRKGKEGSNFYDREYKMSNDTARYVKVDKKGNVESKVFGLPSCPFDVITAIYYCRTIDFSTFKKGDKIPFNLILDGSYFGSYLRYMGKEKWTDPNTDVEYDCIVFKPYLIEGTVFDNGEKMTVYVTDDEHKIPVYIETELVVGKGKVFLTGTSGLK
ncbi:DUF3108 domain-containing protein [Halocola ammonii]